MELTLVGLQYSGELTIANEQPLITNKRCFLIGKTTFVNVIAVSENIQIIKKYCNKNIFKKVISIDDLQFLNNFTRLN